MSVLVRVPTPLRKFTQGADEVSAQGSNVKAIVEDLEKRAAVRAAYQSALAPDAWMKT